MKGWAVRRFNGRLAAEKKKTKNKNQTSRRGTWNICCPVAKLTRKIY